VTTFIKSTTFHFSISVVPTLYWYVYPHRYSLSKSYSQLYSDMINFDIFLNFEKWFSALLDL